MGSMTRRTRARRLVLVAAASGAVAGTLGATSAGASVRPFQVTAPYSCKGSALGESYTFSGSNTVSGTTPTTVTPGTSVSMTEFQAVISVPSSIVNEILQYAGAISGTVKTYDISATDAKTAKVNVAGSGIAIPKTTLTENQPLNIEVPLSPAAVGPWVAKSKGTMKFKTGATATTLSVAGISVSISCTPNPATVISTTAVS